MTLSHVLARQPRCAFAAALALVLPAMASAQAPVTTSTLTPPATSSANSTSTSSSTSTRSGAVTTPSGLIYRSLRDGSGPSPAASDSVKVNYRGTLADGREFDSSYARNEPASFALDHVIKCWTEGVQRMKVGGKAELVCPPQIAYGTRGAGGVIPPGATLRFEIELLEVKPR
jgi:FKBP-type peptidyl-prolyl cis-trans isomerase FkpA